MTMTSMALVSLKRENQEITVLTDLQTAPGYPDTSSGTKQAPEDR